MKSFMVTRERILTILVITCFQLPIEISAWIGTKLRHGFKINNPNDFGDPLIFTRHEVDIFVSLKAEVVLLEEVVIAS